jgi:hypothetical protein
MFSRQKKVEQNFSDIKENGKLREVHFAKRRGKR